VEQIRANKANAHVNIVMTSGLNVETDCLERGANHFIMKPFMPDDLLALLKSQ
jgi:DNA-binding response OmpR family regulator